MKKSSKQNKIPKRYSAHLKGTLFAQINSLFLSHSFVKIFNLHLNCFNSERTWLSVSTKLDQSI